MSYENKNLINILGINVSTLGEKDVLAKIKEYVNSASQHYLVTPNPEIILGANEDEELFYILNKADFAVPDGTGLKFAAWAMGKNIKRITGADLTQDILNIADEQNLKVGIVNWNRGLSGKDDIKKYFNNAYSNLSVLIEDVDKQKATKLLISNLVAIREFLPDILFVTMGCPYQEKFIYHNLANLPSVKLAIGVGGSFDFLTDKTSRAPKFLRILGLEWLWRSFTHKGKEVGDRKRRLRKIKNAVITFPWKFLKWKFIYPFLYRANVACLLYKKENNKYYILIVERREEGSHWQLPQGGLDRLSIEEAGLKELSEEINCHKVKPIKTFKNLYKYKFGDRPGETIVRAEQAQRHTGYKGQKQSLFIAEFFGQDGDIKINYWDHSAWRWVDSDKLIQSAHPIRREATRIYLDKFNSIAK